VIVTILGTGSKGNAIIVESEGTRVLVDAGFGPRTLGTRMAAMGIAPESIAAIVVTHEHTDHVSGACAAARKWGWKIYATAGTIMSTPGMLRLRPTAVDVREHVALDTMRVRCVRIPHDAMEPVALVVEAPATGTRVGIALDLGHVPAGVESALRDLDALIVESNHDLDMLRHGPYPPSVQDRIAGARGHLDNRAAARLARSVAHRGLRHVVLAHLSEHNNSAAVAQQTADAALRTSAFRGSLSVARQDAVTQFSVERRRRVVQLAFDL
jgi:phosphoribosyl 1,2-cyclic phosphodiesterase